MQLGVLTQRLNLEWLQLSTGQPGTDAQRQLRHRPVPWVSALDGRIEGSGAVPESKFMQLGQGSKYMLPLQRNSFSGAVLNLQAAAKWVEIRTNADPLYQHLLVTAERRSWHSVVSGEVPRLFDV